ncbi:MAG: hypothetical protein AB8I58_02540 [Anaerolineales bacterium]|jgi:hypothetical protein
MNLIGSNLVSAGAFFLFIFLSGFWLNRAGRPHGMLPVTIHKLIGLALGVYLAWMIYQINKLIPLSSIQIIAVAVTVLFFAVNVVTGSLLSTNKPMPEAVSLVNKWFPYLTVISTGVMLYLLS